MRKFLISRFQPSDFTISQFKQCKICFDKQNIPAKEVAVSQIQNFFWALSRLPLDNFTRYTKLKRTGYKGENPSLKEKLTKFSNEVNPFLLKTKIMK